MRRTIENCTTIKMAMGIPWLDKPLTEEHEGKTYCQGYEGADGDPYETCQTCKVSIYSLEVQE